MALVVKLPDTEEEIIGLRELRALVFVSEQGVPVELEIDELDDRAIHIVACYEKKVIGTGRLVIDDRGGAQIGRMAVLASHRRSGVGTSVLCALEEQAMSRGIRRITLNAQYHVVTFYTGNGYVQSGVPFLEAGIKHVEMHKQLRDCPSTGGGEAVG